VVDDTAPMWFTELVGEAIRSVGTQTELAARISSTQQSVSLWAAGRVKDPSPVAVAKLAIEAGRDPIDVVHRFWPELAQFDRLSHLRDALAAATDDELALVEEAARGILDQMRSDRAPGAKSQRQR
jgi:transcriptional regulator with XRE-family HTH domain